MTAENLAVCFAPSLLSLPGQASRHSWDSRKKSVRSNKGSTARSPKEASDSTSHANECLTLMIQECQTLLMVSKARRHCIDDADPRRVSFFSTDSSRLSSQLPVYPLGRRRSRFVSRAGRRQRRTGRLQVVHRLLRSGSSQGAPPSSIPRKSNSLFFSPLGV